jgi:tRNA(Met) cytidine acetyltransferase
MRIAVHPGVQGRGLGLRLMEAIEQEARRTGADWLGASFGATPDLLGFWRRAGMHPLRAGITQEASSGSHSVMVLKGLSERGQALCREARARFLAHLPHQLSGPLADLDPLLAAELMRHEERDPRPGDLAPQDWLDLVAFVFGGRGYEDSHPAVWNLACLGLSEPDIDAGLSPEQAALLAAAVLMKHPWERLARSFELAGRRGCLESLRQALEPLIERYASAQTLALRDRLR